MGFRGESSKDSFKNIWDVEFIRRFDQDASQPPNDFSLQRRSPLLRFPEEADSTTFPHLKLRLFKSLAARGGNCGQTHPIELAKRSFFVRCRTAPNQARMWCSSACFSMDLRKIPIAKQEVAASMGAYEEDAFDLDTPDELAC